MKVLPLRLTHIYIHAKKGMATYTHIVKVVLTIPSLFSTKTFFALCIPSLVQLLIIIH